MFTSVSMAGLSEDKTGVPCKIMVRVQPDAVHKSAHIKVSYKDSTFRNKQLTSCVDVEDDAYKLHETVAA